MAAIVLVGGKNSAHLSSVCSEPFLFWTMQWLKTQKFNQIVFSAAHHADKIEAFANDATHREPQLCLDVVVEPTPLGTAGAAALSAKRHPAAISLVINGDSLLLEEFQNAYNKLKTTPTLDGILFATTLPNAGRFGRIELNEHNRLMAFKEKEAGQGPVNAGVYLLRNDLLDEIPSDKSTSLEYDYFPTWLKQNKNFEVIVSQAPFLDMGAQGGQPLAAEFIEKYQASILDQALDLGNSQPAAAL